MTAGLLLLLVAAGFTVMGIMQSFRAHTRHYGFIPVVFRYFTGRQRHGLEGDDRRRDDRYDPYSTRYDRQARISLAADRWVRTVGLPCLFLAIVTGKRTFIALALLFGVVYVVNLIWRLMRNGRLNFYKAGERKRDKFIRKIEYVRPVKNKGIKPLHNVLAPIVGIPLATRPNAWIHVSYYKSEGKKHQVERVTFNLPKNYQPSEAERTRIKQIAIENLGMGDASTARWSLAGNDSMLEVSEAVPPPRTVSLKDIAKEIDETGQDGLVLGVGRGHERVKVSMTMDSPHVGVSVAAGGGKSELAKTAASQVLHNGGIVLILDIKRISHPWARDLPNVRYARDVVEIHDALLWLAQEIDRRTRVADVGMDVEGNVMANVGPRLFVIAEELNETSARLRRYWTDNKTRDDQKKSPALEGLEGCLFMGRQVRVNMFAAAQMMTAIVAGSGAARENMGVRILGRYTRNNWRMLVPEYEMPLRSTLPGRIQVVTSKVQECQVALLSGAEARKFALSGTVTAFPKPLSGNAEVATVHSTIPKVISEIDLPEADAEIVDEEEKLVTLPEAVKLQVVQCNLKALYNARERDRFFPVHIAQRMEARGKPKEYRPADLRRWERRVRGQNK